MINEMENLLNGCNSRVEIADKAAVFMIDQ
jgi:hypothetical protein